jgi:hypothetical protein
MVTAAWSFQHAEDMKQAPQIAIILATAGVCMLGLGPLTVADEGDQLAIRFGPLPLFQKRIAYDSIESVEIGQTSLIDGWGIHMSLKGGWVWNIWGGDCVVIRHGGKTTRVGTDDAEHLAGFLRDKLGLASPVVEEHS